MWTLVFQVFQLSLTGFFRFPLSVVRNDNSFKQIVAHSWKICICICSPSSNHIFVSHISVLFKTLKSRQTRGQPDYLKRKTGWHWDILLQYDCFSQFSCFSSSQSPNALHDHDPLPSTGSPATPTRAWVLLICLSLRSPGLSLVETYGQKTWALKVTPELWS